MHYSEEHGQDSRADAEMSGNEYYYRIEDGYASDGVESQSNLESRRCLEQTQSEEPWKLDWFHVKEAFCGRWPLRSPTECWQMCRFQLSTQGVTVQHNGWASLCIHKQDCVTALVEGLEWWERRSDEDSFVDILHTIAGAECRICPEAND